MNQKNKNIEEKIKTFCYYFPQFYSISENDEHWGKGFTDWDNVKSGKPLFKNHYQPRVPLNSNYYDQSKKEVIEKQVEQAQSAGINGFCFYHYWFDGKLVLEKPSENFLENKNLDLEFCFCWANETWSKRWIGDDTTIILQQNHLSDEKIWKKHFEYLKKFFLDDRYLKKNGRPVFLIYQPELIKDFDLMKECWNKLAKENGIKEIYFIATKSHEFKNIKKIQDSYDGIMNFQPREIYNSGFYRKKSIFNSKYVNFLRFSPEKFLNILTKIKYVISKKEIINYSYIWDLILKKAEKENYIGEISVYQSGFVGWDNTARYGNKAKVYNESTPELFSQKLKKLIEIEKNKGKEFIFINAWNEWSEGTYLEPDEKYKNEYIKKTKEVLRDV